MEKDISKFVVEEQFLVKNVLGESSKTSILPPMATIGGRFSAYNTGFKQILTLEVMADNPDCPVEIISFSGYSPLISGSNIKAKIPAYKLVEKKRLTHINKSIYEPFIKKTLGIGEEAIEISIIANGVSLRVDRSTEYADYIRYANQFIKS